MKQERQTVILKIGGSVITHKHREGVFLRRKLLSQIGKELRHALKEHPHIRLILIHGAGAGGHQLAKRYRLKDGIGHDSKKWKGALLTRIANQELNLNLFKIFEQTGLRVIPVHTASVAIQENAKIRTFSTEAIDGAFANECVPLLYGELVFDTSLGMSILSGDTSAVFLAKRYDATRILFASDIDGIFDKDPHKNRNAKLIRATTLSELLENKNIALAGSHSVDVTGGLANKVSELVRNGLPSSLRTVTIFNGLKPENFRRVLTGEQIGTILEI